MTYNITGDYRDLSIKVNRDKWVHRFFEMAKMVSTWSKDPSTKVGAVLVTSNCKVVGIGYNGLFPCLDDNLLESSDKEFKYIHTVHAEQNAIANCAQLNNNEDLYMFVTKSPCVECAKYIKLFGLIKSVYWLKSSDDFNQRWNNDSAKSLFKNTNILIHECEFVL